MALQETAPITAPQDDNPRVSTAREETTQEQTWRAGLGREGKERAPREGETPSTQTGGEGEGEGHPGRGEPPGGSLEAPRPNCEQRSPGRGTADVRPGPGSPASGAKERTGSRLDRIPFQAAGPPPGRGPGRVRARGGSWRSVAFSGTPSPRTRPRGRCVPRPWRAGPASHRPPGGAVYFGICRRGRVWVPSAPGRRSARRVRGGNVARESHCPRAALCMSEPPGSAGGGVPQAPGRRCACWELGGGAWMPSAPGRRGARWGLGRGLSAVRPRAAGCPPGVGVPPRVDLSLSPVPLLGRVSRVPTPRTRTAGPGRLRRRPEPARNWDASRRMVGGPRCRVPPGPSSVPGAEGAPGSGRGPGAGSRGAPGSRLRARLGQRLGSPGSAGREGHGSGGVACRPQARGALRGGAQVGACGRSDAVEATLNRARAGTRAAGGTRREAPRQG